MPLIFIYSVAVSSAFVLGGSILVGPQTMLPKTAGAPTAIVALCRSPALSLLQEQADRFLPAYGGVPSFVAVLYAWELVAAPPLDLCEDVSVSANDILKKDWELGLSQGAASFVDPRVRAAKWAFTAALPSGSDDPPASTLIELSPLTFAVQDDKSFGVPHAIAHASIHAFHPNDHAGGMQCAPGVVNGTATNATNAAGVAQIRLQLDLAGCSPGELIVRVTSMGLERFASVRLYTPSPAPSASYAVTSSFTTELNNHTTVTAQTTMRVTHSLATRSIETTVNRTTLIYTDAERTSVESVTSDVTTVSDTERAYHMLVVLEPPPSEVELHTPFNVTLFVITQDGVPVAGVEISVALLTLRTTNTKLAGTLRGFTDASGLATLTLQYTAGTTHTHTLLVRHLTRSIAQSESTHRKLFTNLK